MNNFNISWYLVCTQPRLEKSIALKLNQRKIEYFLPLTKQLSERKNRRKYLMKPLFPSYVFVRLNSAQEFFLVKDLDGVRNYVRFGKEIAKVSESVIDQLKSISGQHSGIEVSSDVFMHGEFLHIYNGPLTGLLCEVVEYQGKKKVLVRVNLLNRTVVVDLPINSFSIMA